MTLLSADLAESARLRRELAGYLIGQVDDGAHLLCRAQKSCRSSVGNRTMVEGQGSHVGTHYAIEDAGRSLRILIVPKQVGGKLDHGRGRGQEHITVDSRSAQVDKAKTGPRPHPRTDHMIGTGLALKTLLGMPADGPETWVLDGDPIHIFDCMAMANSSLCSMVGANASGQGSRVMISNCTTHLARTVQILRPNIVVAQGYRGAGWSPSKAVATVLGIPLPPRNSLTTAETSNGPVAFVAAVHPSRLWFTTTMPAWRELEPVFLRARHAAQGLSPA